MAHGLPDYGANTPKVTVYGLSDMAELAVRLGSFVSYDRQGDVMCLDGFESGLRGFLTGGDGLGNSVTQDSTYSRNGAFSAKMVCGSTLGRSATLNKFLQYPVMGNLGIEFSSTMHADIETLKVSAAIYDGTNSFIARLIYNEDTSILTYLNSAGAEVPLQAGLVLEEHPYLFHTLKYVVDYKNRKYVRAMLDERSWDMTDIPLYSTLSANPPNMLIAIGAIGKIAVNAAIHVDDFIITQNEP